MLKDMQPLEKLLGWDCRQKTISNILRYKQYKHYKTVWKQCGSVFVKYDAKPGSLHSEYMSLEQELNWINKIAPRIREQMDGVAFVQELRQLVAEEEPVMVYVDTFALKDNIYYHKEHFLHTITLIDYKHGVFTYIDDTYSLRTTLDTEDLLLAAAPDYPYKGPLEKGILRNYLYLSTEQATPTLDRASLFQVLSLNTACLKGAMGKDAVWKKHAQVEEVVVGLDGLQRLIDDWTMYLGTEQHLDLEALVSIYADLRNASHTRHKYAFFLKQFADDYADIEQLSALYEELSASWHSSANQALKAVTYNEQPEIYSIVRKLLRKLTKILEVERIALERSEHLQATLTMSDSTLH